MLGNKEMRKMVTKYYEDSGEPELVRKAVKEALVKEQSHNQTQQTSSKLHQWRYDKLSAITLGCVTIPMTSTENFFVEHDV